MLSRTLSCARCGWQTLCGAEQIAQRLRLVGLLRREAHPEEAILVELLTEAVGRMTCPGCRQVGLVATESDTPSELDDWQAAVLCTVCREPIAQERLEALPGVKQCTACQGKTEAGTATEEPDFCPRCGSLVELRVSRSGGLTRYRQFCTGGCRL